MYYHRHQKPFCFEARNLDWRDFNNLTWATGPVHNTGPFLGSISTTSSSKADENVTFLGPPAFSTLKNIQVLPCKATNKVGKGKSSSKEPWYGIH